MGAPPRRDLITEWEAGAPLVGISTYLPSSVMELAMFDHKTNTLKYLDTPDVQLSDNERLFLLPHIAQAFIDCNAGSVNEDITLSEQGILLVFHEGLSALKQYEMDDKFANDILKKIAEAAEKNNDSTFSVFSFSY
jgi:hypothetical protein